MGNLNTLLRHHLIEVTVTKRMGHIPANKKQNELFCEPAALKLQLNL
jgi:hypothetical protein